MKKIFLVFLCILFSNYFFAQSSNIENFIKGNIAEKTTAVRKATGKDAVWLSSKAINFVLESKEYLPKDRELDGLAVAAILSYPQDYIKNSSEQNKENILNSFISLFEASSNSTTVQTAIISKISSLRNSLNISPFINVLNRYISTTNLSSADSDVVNAVLNLLATNGNSESFSISYAHWYSKKYSSYNVLFEKIIVSLLPVSMNEAVAIVNSTSTDQIIAFFNLLFEKKSQISENSLSEVSLNVLSNTILLVKNSQKKVSEITDLQVRALTVLSENKWTRASSVVVSFFNYAKGLYENNDLADEDFVVVIKSLPNVSPLESVSPLISFLRELNSSVERKQEVSEPVVIAVITTLGAIGDKSAFDDLLSVTYYNYPQTVLSAAREALAGLKW